MFFQRKKGKVLFLMLVWLGYLQHDLWCFSLWASSSSFVLKVWPQHSCFSSFLD